MRAATVRRFREGSGKVPGLVPSPKILTPLQFPTFLTTYYTYSYTYYTPDRKCSNGGILETGARGMAASAAPETRKRRTPCAPFGHMANGETFDGQASSACVSRPGFVPRPGRRTLSEVDPSQVAQGEARAVHPAQRTSETNPGRAFAPSLARVNLEEANRSMAKALGLLSQGLGARTTRQ